MTKRLFAKRPFAQRMMSKMTSVVWPSASTALVVALSLAILTSGSLAHAAPRSNMQSKPETQTKPAAPAKPLSSKASPKAVAKPVPKAGSKVVTTKAKAPPKATAPAIAWDQFETPLQNLREKSAAWSASEELLAQQSLDDLEGIANDAVLAKTIKAVYTEATSRKWTQTQSFRIFPIEHLMSNSGLETPATFNPGGLRVGVFALRLGNTQRGVILTSSFQAINPVELRTLYKSSSMLGLVEGADTQFAAFASELVERFRDDDSRRSRHLPVIGSAEAWVVGCETTLAGRFCVNASLFDANDTDPLVFIDALTGAHENSDLVRKIRDQNLAWPIDRTYISRGYKPCGCNGRHYGIDLTAPIGTPVRSVAQGRIRAAKNFSGWGRAIVIEHELPSGENYISLYAHLNKFEKAYKPGDVIQRGELIAQSGKSGSSSRGAPIPPHLHLEIRKVTDGKEPLEQPRTMADRPLDPLRVLDVFNVFLGGDLSVPVDRKF